MRISASSYSNTAPLVWSFLYGRNHGRVEIILDNAPTRSAELLETKRVDAALVPVITYQTLNDILIVPDVCVGAREKVRSVCLVTNGVDLVDVRSVALDISSKTSVVLTKIIFREFFESEPEWRDAEPNVEKMLAENDAALIIGDPALRLAECGMRVGDFPDFAIRHPQAAFKTYDLAELWHQHTGLGFVFAMWMTRHADLDIDFATARDEGLEHIDEIAANYAHQTGLDRNAMKHYLTRNISYTPDESMLAGLDLYFELAGKHGLIENKNPISANG